MELLNIHYVYNVDIPLKGQNVGHVEISGVYLIHEGDQYRIQNQSAHPVLAYEVVKDGQHISINRDFHYKKEGIFSIGS
jgi:hypothetical protein